MTNKQFHLVSRPSGEASTANFKLIEAALPGLADGQVLVRHHYLSLDPYMRGRMNDAKSYAPPQKLNEVMVGGTVGEVIESRHPSFAAGDRVVGMGRQPWIQHLSDVFPDFTPARYPHRVLVLPQHAELQRLEPGIAVDLDDDGLAEVALR